MTTAIQTPAHIMSKDDVKLQRKSITWSSLAVGAAMNIFQVSTLGQPLENIKTYVSFTHNIHITPADNFRCRQIGTLR